jgi:hypothetical protein
MRHRYFVLVSAGLIGAATLGLASCQSTTSRAAQPGEYDPRATSYFRDPRTQLCFAVSVYDRTDAYGKTASGMSHTHVPCTNEVVALLSPLPQ